ncbi:poly [ADP-ribose] polymerase tankyrase-2-like [Dysidea avara]|uniref:poly [ADP-ribose] polymerase tankyrase-2-like n=1 Tax=Dysidea avara TaxID=196820 RepID=UPI0033339187
MEWLLRNMPRHADVNHSNKKGYTPLLIACYYQKMELLKFLLDHDQVSVLAAVTSDGKTALHLAAMRDSVEIAELLINKEFPIDEDDENGETALHVAYKKGSYQVWKLLLEEGADSSKKNKDGKCPENLKHQDLRVPVEIVKRGEKAVERYLTALRKGKKKIPRCKLMIVGEAGVGKTNFLNLLTREKFVAKHEETNGVDIDLVSTSDISTETWKKSTIETNEEYRNIAAGLVADQLHNSVPPKSREKKKCIFC